MIQDKISNVKKDVSSDKIDVDDLNSNVSDIIVSAGDMTLKRKSFWIKKKKPLKINNKVSFLKKSLAKSSILRTSWSNSV